MPFLVVPMLSRQGQSCCFAFGHRGLSIPASAQLDFLKAVDDLMKVKNKMSSVRNEQATVAVESWARKSSAWNIDTSQHTPSN